MNDRNAPKILSRRELLAAGAAGVIGLGGGAAWKVGFFDDKDPYLFNLYDEVKAMKKGGSFDSILTHSQLANYDKLAGLWSTAYLTKRDMPEALYTKLTEMNLLPATERAPAIARVLYHVAHSAKHKEAADFIADIISFCPDAARIRFVGNPDGTEGQPLSIVELLRAGRSFNQDGKSGTKYDIPPWDENSLQNLQQQITAALLASKRLNPGSDRGR